MKKKYIPIKGMHCKSCELLIEDKLSKISAVKQSSLNYKKGVAEISYDSEELNVSEIENAIREAGYSIGETDQKKFFSHNAKDYRDLGIAALALIVFYVILHSFGFTNFNLNDASNPSSLGMVFLVGITAGLSTCMALVGGLTLAISALYAEKHPQASVMQKFRPHLFFNLGRVTAYVILGGFLGALGSLFQLSIGALGVMTIIVGISMLILGVKLIGIFPKIENNIFVLPKKIGKILGSKRKEKEYSHKNSVIFGALTFFLPCGFTQAMQLFSITTGSFMQGSLIMGIFALGTTPGLLGVGAVASFVKGNFARIFFKFAGIIVILLAFFNISNGTRLFDWNKFFVSSDKAVINEQKTDPNVTIENGVQIVRMTETANGYSPNKFTLKKGVPVKWVVTAKDPYSCASSLVMQKFNVRKNLLAGENIIEFMPTETGQIPFSCGMGMYTGAFTVVDDQEKNDLSVSQNSNFDLAPTGVNCGGGCAAAKKTGVLCGSGSKCGGEANGHTGGCGGSGKVAAPTVGTFQNAQNPL